jgi:3-hydroxy-9,10-secoandrosta-1,3,5(10)-triene-9,17-dione monooxygenase reductase component
MAIDKGLFRSVAGSFATGVTILTTGSRGRFGGLTANAFTSLSLEPPLVLVCIDQSAHTLPLLRETGYFTVNILAAGQEELSRRFASPDAPEDKMRGTDFVLGTNGVPILPTSIAYFECRVAREHDGGDHSILIGEVITGDLLAVRRPLVYFRGEYH